MLHLPCSSCWHWGTSAWPTQSSASPSSSSAPSSSFWVGNSYIISHLTFKDKNFHSWDSCDLFRNVRKCYQPRDLEEFSLFWQEDLFLPPGSVRHRHALPHLHDWILGGFQQTIICKSTLPFPGRSFHLPQYAFYKLRLEKVSDTLECYSVQYIRYILIWHHFASDYRILQVYLYPGHVQMDVQGE